MIQNPVAPTNEVIANLFMSNIDDKTLADFNSDPHGFLLSNFNVNFDRDIQIKTVDNDEATVNLTLPYYSGLEKFQALALSQESLEEITGGEIALSSIILAIVTFFGSIGFAVGVTGGGAAPLIGGIAVVAGGVAASAAGHAAVAGAIGGGVEAANNGK